MYEDVISEARNFYLNYVNQIPVDLRQICKDKNWDILMYDLKGEDGYTIISPSKKVTICCDNSFKNVLTKRYRFTIAHEIAHLILGHMEINPFKLSKFERIRIDKEADAFASELLMPYSELVFLNLSSELNEVVIHDLAVKFQVSNQAMKVRLNMLGYETVFSNSNSNCNMEISEELAF